MADQQFAENVILTKELAGMIRDTRVHTVEEWQVLIKALVAIQSEVNVCVNTVEYNKRSEKAALFDILAGQYKRTEQDFLKASQEVDRLKQELEKVRTDAERYKLIREEHWSKNTICVVQHPNVSVKLGSSCPSHEILDELVDDMRKERING